MDLTAAKPIYAGWVNTAQLQTRRSLRSQLTGACLLSHALRSERPCTWAQPPMVGAPTRCDRMGNAHSDHSHSAFGLTSPRPRSNQRWLTLACICAEVAY